MEPATDAVMVTKLRPPPVPIGAVDRPKLVQRVGLRGRRLTLLAAPPGWGKTTLLAQWCMSVRGDARVAFVGLDELDNDPVRFWAALLAGLRPVGFGSSVRVPMTAGAAGPGFWEALVPALVNELAATEERVVLVLDDYQIVTDEGVHDGMGYLVEHLPGEHHVVISTRQQPPFSLARLRAGGGLEEIDSDDLALDGAQMAELVHTIAHIDLSVTDTEVIHGRTEGWPAGVHLAALSLRGRGSTSWLVDEFAGDHRDVGDYLTAEVLARVPSELRRFMLRCSVLERLNASLCDAVTGEGDGHERLREAEALNLFLIPLDTRRGWYRFHRLFAGWLRHELLAEAPDELPELHRRASAWYEEHDAPIEAVDHAIAGGELERVRRLILAHGSDLTARGRVATVVGWLAKLPDDFLAADPALAVLAAAGATALDVDLDRAGRFADAAERALAARTPADAPTAPEVDIAAIRAAICLVRNDPSGAIRLARRVVPFESDPSLERFGIAHVILATALFWTGQLAEARGVIDEIWADVETTYVKILAAGVLAAACFESRDLDRAERVARYATELADERHVGPSPEMALNRLALGAVLAERGEFEAADIELARGIELSEWWRVPAQAAYGRMLQARLRLMQGRLADARQLLREAAPVVESTRAMTLLGRVLGRTETALRRPGKRTLQGPIGDLTDRELDVLRLLTSHLTQREIGGQLGVSMNTIKSYVQSLYRKLGVSSRTDAIDRARSLHLL